jgi:hypothetical protein
MALGMPFRKIHLLQSEELIARELILGGNIVVDFPTKLLD